MVAFGYGMSHLMFNLIPYMFAVLTHELSI